MNNRSPAVERCLIPFAVVPLIFGGPEQCNFKTCASGYPKDFNQQTAGVRFFPLFFSSMPKTKQATHRRFWNANVSPA
jgi:hypothetical protein